MQKLYPGAVPIKHRPRESPRPVSPLLCFSPKSIIPFIYVFLYTLPSGGLYCCLNRCHPFLYNPCTNSKKNKGQQKLINTLLTLSIIGARDENRTRTPIRARDFKSLASTSSATQAPCLFLPYASILLQ